MKQDIKNEEQKRERLKDELLEKKTEFYKLNYLSTFIEKKNKGATKE